MSDKVRSAFFHAASAGSAPSSEIERIWTDIESSYSSESRHYHNLRHLEQMYIRLEQHKEVINDWNSIVFALVFHDIRYDVLTSDNEGQSARVAADELKKLNIPSGKTMQLILATKKHEPSTDPDINLFIDSDLSILGAHRLEYAIYAQNIRREYQVYPDPLYNVGRISVLERFLHKQPIFKSESFRNLLERRALANLQWEIDMLKSKAQSAISKKTGVWKYRM